MPDHVELSAAVLSAYDAKAVSAIDAKAAERVAKLSGYSTADLQGADALSGLSCGNPTAVAALKTVRRVHVAALTRQGEAVVDLGSGGGFDVLQAARKVGPSGFSIGLDAAPNMLARARANAERQGLRPPHVAFASADLTQALPLQSASVDVFISNCVINLLSSEHKAALFRELHRCLRGGGRLAISDILARRPMPEHVLSSFAARVGCIGGAITVEEQRTLLIEAGFDGASTPLEPSSGRSQRRIIQREDSGPQRLLRAGLELRSNMRLERARRSAGQFQRQRARRCARVVSRCADASASFDILAVKAAGDAAFVDPYGDGPLTAYNLAFPAPRVTCSAFSAEEAAEAIRAGDPNLLLIDVRRADYKDSTVHGAINWPAQRIPLELDQLIGRVQAYKRVALFCGSSRGRGPRSAA